jgi:hypothetical protein
MNKSFEQLACEGNHMISKCLSPLNIKKVNTKRRSQKIEESDIACNIVKERMEGQQRPFLAVMKTSFLRHTH